MGDNGGGAVRDDEVREDDGEAVVAEREPAGGEVRACVEDEELDEQADGPEGCDEAADGGGERCAGCERAAVREGNGAEDDEREENESAVGLDEVAHEGI